MSAGRAAVDLRERLEQRLERVRRNPDAAVADSEVHEHAALRQGLDLGANGDLARVGELDRIPDQVDEYLPQQSGVAMDGLRGEGIDEAGERQALAARRHGHDVGYALHYRGQIELDRLAFELVRLDLRKVEDVIDDRQQIMRRRAGDSRQFAELVDELRIKYEIEAADDPVHRGTYLMAHRRQELGFHNRRSQCGVAGVSEPALDSAALAHIADKRHKQLSTAGFKTVDRSLERELAAIAALTGAREALPAVVLRVIAQPLDDVFEGAPVPPGDEALDFTAKRSDGGRLVEALGGAVEVDDPAVAVDHHDRIHAGCHDRTLDRLAGLERLSGRVGTLGRGAWIGQIQPRGGPRGGRTRARAGLRWNRGHDNRTAIPHEITTRTFVQASL